MQTFVLLWMVVLTVAVVLAFLGAGQLTARLVAAEKQIADLKSSAAQQRRPATPTTIDWTDGHRCFVLAIEPRCLACKDRVRELDAYVAELSAAETNEDRYIVLSPDTFDLTDTSNERVQVIVDGHRFGHLAITATPSVMTFAADGTELTRTVVGSKNALQGALDQFELVTARRPS